MNERVQRFRADVLVIGGGAAGAMAAIGAREEGVDVLLATKSTFLSGSTSMARSGYATAFGHVDPRDGPEAHFADTVAGGFGINNQRLVQIMVEEAPAVTREVDSWGLGLVKNGDKYDQRLSPGDTYPRLVHCEGMINKPITRTLMKRVSDLGVRVLPHVFVCDLIVRDGHVRGALGLLYRDNEWVVLEAGAVVLVTGGAAQLHSLNDSPPSITGDGYAMALRAGAELIDMEMIDYQLLTAGPPRLRGYPPASSSFIRNGAYFLNNRGERFMEKYDPVRKERIGLRCVLNRAVTIEIMEGRGSEHGGVYLDARHCYDKMVAHSGETVRAFASAGVDLRTDFAELCSGPHTYLGGVRVDTESRTSVPGLFAGGEAAGGVHGANRLGGAALLDALVFGLRSGRFAAHYARRESPAGDSAPLGLHDSSRWSELVELSERNGSVGVAEFRARVQRVVEEDIGLVRSRTRLERALDELASLRAAARDLSVKGSTESETNDNFRKAYETLNLIQVAECLARSALVREESRGAHYRVDFPRQDDERWLANVVVRLDGDDVAWEVAPRVTV